MDLLRMRKDLNNNGFVVTPFPQAIKESMINYIKSYLFSVATKQSQFNTLENNGNYESNSAVICSMADRDYLQNFSKPFRMFPDDISQLLLDWVKIEMRRILGATQVDSNYVSLSERRINQNLKPTTYDIFWRCIRRHRNDVGPAHCDYQFWNLAKGTDDEVPVPFFYRERWKIWIPLIDCVKENMLQMMPSSHREDIPMQVIETPVGKRPWLESEWYENNKNRFIAPDANLDEECIVFHDRLIHRGPKNHHSNLRISSELTVLVV